MVYRLIKGIFMTPDTAEKKKVKREKKSSFNIDENDIEDAKFKEIKKKNK